MYVVIGLVRAQFGPDQAVSTRYLYVAMPFVLVIGLATWRSFSERFQGARWIGPILVGSAVAGNLIAYVGVRNWWTTILASDPLAP